MGRVRNVVWLIFSLTLSLLLSVNEVLGFGVHSSFSRKSVELPRFSGVLSASKPDAPASDATEDANSPREAATEQQEIEESMVANEKAVTGTVNERLQAELKAAADKEKYGARSAMGKKMGLEGFKSTKTDAEREAAIQEARDLNGVDPVVTIVGSFFALAMAAGLWFMTSWVAEYFALHPVESDALFVRRISAVFRNVVVGMVSLASGFFGVTGVGIFALGVRVAYGVLAGELDPTPLRKNQQAAEELDMPNVWDLMMNKKPGRRRK